MNPNRGLNRRNLKEQNGDMQEKMRRLAQELQYWKSKAQQLEQEIMFGYDMVLALTVEKIRESNFQTMVKGDNVVAAKDTALSLEFMREAKNMYTLDIDRDLERKMIILRPTLKPKSTVKDEEPEAGDVGKDE